MYDKRDTNLRSLRAICIQVDTYGCILVSMLENKLPKEINLLLSRKFDPEKGLWEIAGLTRELKMSWKPENAASQRRKPKRIKFIAQYIVLQKPFWQ